MAPCLLGTILSFVANFLSALSIRTRGSMCRICSDELAPGVFDLPNCARVELSSAFYVSKVSILNGRLMAAAIVFLDFVACKTCDRLAVAIFLLQHGLYRMSTPLFWQYMFIRGCLFVEEDDVDVDPIPAPNAG